MLKTPLSQSVSESVAAIKIQINVYLYTTYLVSENIDIFSLYLTWNLNKIYKFEQMYVLNIT